METFHGLCERARIAFNKDKWRKAKRLYKLAIRKSHDLDNDEFAAVHGYLANCYYRLKWWDHAKVQYCKALQLLGPNKTSTVQAIKLSEELARTLSIAFSEPARGREAVMNYFADLETLLEAIEIHRKNLGLLNDVGLKEDKLKCMHSLAFNLLKLGKHQASKSGPKLALQEAASLYEYVIEADLTVDVHLDHVVMLEVKHNYASVLYHLGIYGPAKVLFQQVEQAWQMTPARKGLDVKLKLRRADLYIEACNEALMDLESSVSRQADNRMSSPLGSENPQSIRQKSSGSIPPRDASNDNMSSAALKSSNAEKSSLQESTSPRPLKRPRAEDESETLDASVSNLYKKARKSNSALGSGVTRTVAGYAIPRTGRLLQGMYIALLAPQC